MQDVIQTERLLIRRVREDDWRAIQAIWADVAASEFAQYDRPYHLEDEAVRRSVAENAAYADSEERIFFVVCLEDAVIGYVPLYRYHNNYEIGYCFRSDYYGRGYARESISAILDYLREKGVPLVTAGTAVKNGPSVRLLMALGFRLIGAEPVSFYQDEEGRPITFLGGDFGLLL